MLVHPNGADKMESLLDFFRNENENKTNKTKILAFLLKILSDMVKLK